MSSPSASSSSDAAARALLQEQLAATETLAHLVIAAPNEALRAALLREGVLAPLLAITAPPIAADALPLPLAPRARVFALLSLPDASLEGDAAATRAARETAGA